MHMVMAVLRRPPQRPALRGTRAQESEEELCQASGTKGAMRKISVIEASDCKHAQHEQRSRKRHRQRAYADPECGNATDVQTEERHGPQPLDALFRGGLDRRSMAVEPGGDARAPAGRCVRAHGVNVGWHRLRAPIFAVPAASWLRHSPPSRSTRRAAGNLLAESPACAPLARRSHASRAQ